MNKKHDNNSNKKKNTGNLKWNLCVCVFFRSFLFVIVVITGGASVAFALVIVVVVITNEIESNVDRTQYTRQRTDKLHEHHQRPNTTSL